MNKEIEEYIQSLSTVLKKSQIKIIKKVFFDLKDSYQTDRYYDIINICCERLLKNARANKKTNSKGLTVEIKRELDLGSENIEPFSSIDDIELKSNENAIDIINTELDENIENYSDYIKSEIIVDILSGLSISEVAEKYNISYNTVLEIITEAKNKISLPITTVEYSKKNKNTKLK